MDRVYDLSEWVIDENGFEQVWRLGIMRVGVIEELFKRTSRKKPACNRINTIRTDSKGSPIDWCVSQVLTSQVSSHH